MKMLILHSCIQNPSYKTIAGNPKAKPILATFDPNTLPITKSACPSKEEMIPTTSSGNDVPTETTVSPITRSEIFKLLWRHLLHHLLTIQNHKITLIEPVKRKEYTRQH